MSLTRSTPKRHAAGFSLLEMLIAMVMLALALGALYQAASGASRNVRIDEKYAYAVELARSVLADNAAVAAGGVNAQGQAGNGFNWTVSTEPVELGRRSLAEPLLHKIEVGVSWVDGSKRRLVTLNSVVEGYVR
ncbi:MAG: prepilin-type N-terminal cleavage/methylation domain-containing protein [Halioglobus sp.]|nr:prepilin-type N-terminal cleavage/methylation domain-containing protein [Halioglobus sp.]